MANRSGWKKWQKKLTALVVAILLLASVSWPALAQEGITVTSNTYESLFAEEVLFRLEARSESEIEKIVLLYRIGSEEVTNRGYPDFSPAKEVAAEYAMDLQRGEIAPFSEIEYFWRIEDAAGNRLDTEPVSFVYEDDRFQWESLTQGKVVLYWYDADRAFAQRLLDIALESLARLEEEVGVEPEEPVRLVVYQSKADMLGALVPRGEVFEAEVITLGTVVSKDTVLLHGTHRGVEKTIAHELSHVVVHLATENPYAGIPAWLDEGLAMYNEGELPAANREALERATRENRLISVRSLTAPTGKPEEINLFYGEVYSVVEFLLKTYGKEKMAELLAVFKEGAAYDDALMKVYGFDQDGLDAQWRESLGLPPRGATPETTAVPAVEKPREGLCFGVVLELALLILFAYLRKV
jgi:hypothetical protein